MILDPTGKIIKNIQSIDDITGKTILEIGCGTGRVTQDLTALARHVTALDPNSDYLEEARARLLKCVEYFDCAGEELPEFPYKFDTAVYPLSLHHIPESAMEKSLTQVSNRLTDEGKIIVVEPGSSGSFIELEKTLGIGDGDETRAKQAAQYAIQNLPGWEIKESNQFRSDIYFDSIWDLYISIVPPEKANDPDLFLCLLDKKIDSDLNFQADRNIYLLERT